MLHVQHLVEQNVLHRVPRDARAVHASVQQNVIGTRVVAAELTAPTAGAPANMRARQGAGEILCVQFVEQSFQIEMSAQRTGGARTNSALAHAIDARAGAIRARQYSR